MRTFYNHKLSLFPTLLFCLLSNLGLSSCQRSPAPKPISIKEFPLQISNVTVDHGLIDSSVDQNSQMSSESITNEHIAFNAGIDAFKIYDGTVNNNEFSQLNGLTDNIQSQITNLSNEVVHKYAGEDVEFKGAIGILTPPSKRAVVDISGSDKKGHSSLMLRSGDAHNFGADAHQILFSYNGTANYTHNIRSRHYAAGAAGNALDFYLWNYGTDAIGTIGSRHVMSIRGDGTVSINGDFSSGGLFIAGNNITKSTGSNEETELVLSGNDPQIKFQDVNEHDWWIHANNGKLLFLSGEKEWSANRPLTITGNQIGINNEFPTESLDIKGNLLIKGNLILAHPSGNNLTLSSSANENDSFLGFISSGINDFKKRSRQYILDRKISATNNEFIEIGEFKNKSGNYSLDLSAQSESINLPQSKKYHIYLSYEEREKKEWIQLSPVAENVQLSHLTEHFQIDAKWSDEKKLRLRIRRINQENLSTSSGSVRIVINDFNSDETQFTPLTATGIDQPQVAVSTLGKSKILSSNLKYYRKTFIPNKSSYEMSCDRQEDLVMNGGGEVKEGHLRESVSINNYTWRISCLSLTGEEINCLSGVITCLSSTPSF